MTALLANLLFLVAQMNTLQQAPVVHLNPHHPVIEVAFGGKLLEVTNAPAVIPLPDIPPKSSPQGTQWSVDVKNLGPRVIAIEGKPNFLVRIPVGQTIHIYSNGGSYSMKR
jgi:hypothetical protein